MERPKIGGYDGRMLHGASRSLSDASVQPRSYEGPNWASSLVYVIDYFTRPREEIGRKERALICALAGGVKAVMKDS